MAAVCFHLESVTTNVGAIVHPVCDAKALSINGTIMDRKSALRSVTITACSNFFQRQFFLLPTLIFFLL